MENDIFRPGDVAFTKYLSTAVWKTVTEGEGVWLPSDVVCDLTVKDMVLVISIGSCTKAMMILTREMLGYVDATRMVKVW